jgi:DNA-binding Lrp family transcriptional regulator
VGCGDIDEVSNLKDAIRKNKSVLDLKVETWTGVKNMPENLELSKQTQQKIPFKSIVENQKLDLELNSIDLQIIDKLTKNSMQPFSNIAKEIGTSINTVSRKYRNLVNYRIIRPVLQINPKKLGYNAMLTFALSLASQSDMASIIDAVMRIKDTFLITKTNGNFDLLLQVFVRDIDQLLSTQNQVANISGISTIEILVYPVPPQWPLPGEYISTF